MGKQPYKGGVMDEKRLAAIEERLSDSVVVHRSVELWRSAHEIRVRPSDVRDLIAAVRERGKPVAWMYVENCETYFGHPDGYRPADAKPLYLAPPTVAAALERAARAIYPGHTRPCDCDSCCCGNLGDAMAVAEWDEATRNVAAIRRLKEEYK